MMSNNTLLRTQLTENLERLAPIISESTDLEKKEIYIQEHQKMCVMLYLSGMTDSNKQLKMINSFSSIDFMTDFNHSFSELFFSKVNPLKKQEIHTIEDVFKHIFSGQTVLLVDGISTAFVIDTEKEKMRSFTEPTTERIVRGPKLGFIESLDENLGLIRQLANDQSIIAKKIEIEEDSSIKRIVYLFNKEKANEELINEVKKRLEKVRTTNVEDSGILEELIEDSPYSPFPQIQNTERPDRVVAALKQGRVVIFSEGSPFALIAPTTIDMLFQSPDDYYERWAAGSFLRLLRYISVAITLFLSAIYISLVSFNPGLLPTELAITIAGTRENVPFPPFVEAMIMEITIELLREAGIRLPSPIGQTIGLVGGVIIGQAAVEANIVSSLMVIIVSITTITSFTVPQYGFALAFRLLRFGAMTAAAVLGIYGTTLFFILISIHLSRLSSFNTPYFTPERIFNPSMARDILIRLPFRRKKVN
ncbi:spore germination protein [Metabacillus idriensis]|nr:spore germination protein [Metabacillus idriensis]MDR0139786.1 spore germination protein [Metabacillus idriensis]